MKYSIILLLLLFSGRCLSASYEPDADLPVVWVETIGNEEPVCDYVEHPEGEMGSSITNATKVPGRLYITFHGSTLYDSQEYVLSESGMTIRLRGNTSAYWPKKAFKVKLQKKADLLNRPSDDSRYTDKDWLLLPMDSRGINTLVGLKVNELMGMQWTPAYNIVNVIFNNDYRGLYLLIESVERNPDCRINVDKQTGYLFECDPYWWNEDVYFKTTMNKKYTFKYPDSDDITSTQISYIQDVMERFEQSLSDGSYTDYIDLESFASWMLAHDILGTWDSGGSNIYITKYDDTPASKLMMGNLWDFDTIEKMDNQWARVHGDYFYYEYLFSHTNDAFSVAYKKKWNEVKGSLFSGVVTWLDDFLLSTEGKALDRSRIVDCQRWNSDYVSLAEEVEQHKKWFTNRKEWMEGAVGGINGISRISNDDFRNASYCIYDLQGRRHSSVSRHGVYIQNGRKIMR